MRRMQLIGYSHPSWFPVTPFFSASRLKPAPAIIFLGWYAPFLFRPPFSTSPAINPFHKHVGTDTILSVADFFNARSRDSVPNSPAAAECEFSRIPTWVIWAIAVLNRVWSVPYVGTRGFTLVTQSGQMAQFMWDDLVVVCLISDIVS